MTLIQQFGPELTAVHLISMPASRPSCGNASRSHPGRIHDPRAELAMAEVHDCFTPTELVLMEDLGFSNRGQGWKDVMSGAFDLDAELAVNPDGGLKRFGHPIGAAGLRMFFEAWLQLRLEAPADRAIASVKTGKKLAMTPQLGRRTRQLRQLRVHRRQRAERIVRIRARRSSR